MSTVDPHAGHAHSDDEMPNAPRCACNRPDGHRPGLRHDGEPEAGHPDGELWRRGLPFLLGQVPDEVPGRSLVLRLGSCRRAQEGRPGQRPVHLPDASRDRSRCAGRLPDLRHGAGADGALGRAQRGTDRLHPPDVDLGRGGGAAHRPDDGRTGRAAGARLDRASDGKLSRVRAGDADHPLGGPAVLPARLGLGGEPIAQHVDADQPRRGGGLSLFAGRDLPAGRVSGALPDGPRRRHLLRGGRGDRGAGLRGPGAGTAGARTHRGRDPRASGSRAQDRAAHPAGRHGIRRAAREHHGGRPAARAPRRCGPGRRDGDRGPLVAGRKHADRRVDAGRKGPGRCGDRGHDQQERLSGDRGGQGRRPTPCWRRSWPWCRTRAGRARRSRGWPTGCRRCSCRRWSPSPSSPSSSG